MVRRAVTRKTSGERPVLADPLYYLSNFRTVLASLQSRYGELLNQDEREFMRQFAMLPEPSCALLVRMIMRRGEYFRLSRLEYPEIGAAAAAAAPLVCLGWLEEPLLDMDALHRLLTKAELVAHLMLPRRVLRSNKAELLPLLRAAYPDKRTFHGWCPQARDRVVHPLIKVLVERFRLLFFGNFHQDWTAFIVSDLGISAYETVSGHTAAFHTRAHIDAFDRLYRCDRLLEGGVELEGAAASIAEPIPDSHWLEEHRQRLLFQIAMAHERSGNLSSALAVHSACRYRGSRMRTVRLLERSQDWEAARELCLIAAASPENEAERQLVGRLLPRLNRKLGLTSERTSVVPNVETFDVRLDASPGGRAIELQLRDHLTRREESYSSVYYVENALINSLFGLLCWEAIFAPVPGAFFHDYQYGPADLESPCFYERRRDRFAACFAALESDLYKDIIRQRIVAKRGVQAPFIAWGLLREPLLECALECFPASHLRLWFQWIVRDVVENRSGFPDLVQFWPHERRYRLVEIKGPGDRLQDNQRRFLEFCSQHQMPVSVCRVRWAQESAASLGCSQTFPGRLHGPRK
jgi:hypothetical protein